MTLMNPDVHLPSSINAALQRPAIAPMPSRPGVGVPKFAGLAAIAVFFVGFGGWAAVAPLQSAVIAQGIVGVESTRKTVQHLEGGIIREILVRDGDKVVAGQELVRLDDTQPLASLDLVRKRRDVGLAMQARLEAQRDLRTILTFPAELLTRRAEVDVGELIRAQTDIFTNMEQSLKGQTAILNQRMQQLRSEITGIEGEIAAEDRQIALLKEQIKTEESLLAKGLSPRARMLELQREEAALEGRRSQNRAAIARANQSIGESQLQAGELKTAFVNDAVGQLGDVQATLFDLTERLRAAQDINYRAVVRAPTEGTVVNLRFHSPGGVIGPGNPILDLVPAEDRLVVEARVEPHDADIVVAGLEAQVRLTAFNQRHALPLMGRVINVSADRLVDERSGSPYYLARVELLPSPLLAQTKINPGMPAEVIVVTSAHTLAAYLLEPISGVFRRALREQQ